MDEKKRKVSSKDLKQDPLVEHLSPEPADAPPNVTELKGYVGKSKNEGYVRVYLNRELSAYAEIPDGDIVFRESLASEADPLAGSRVWVKKDAKLEIVRISSQQVQAEFLHGGITESAFKTLAQEQHIGGQIAGKGPAVGIPTFPGDRIFCKTLWGGYTCNVYRQGVPLHDSDQPGGKCAYTLAGEDVNCDPYGNV